MLTTNLELHRRELRNHFCIDHLEAVGVQRHLHVLPLGCFLLRPRCQEACMMCPCRHLQQCADRHCPRSRLRAEALPCALWRARLRQAMEDALVEAVVTAFVQVPANERQRRHHGATSPEPPVSESHPHVAISVRGKPHSSELRRCAICAHRARRSYSMILSFLKHNFLFKIFDFRSLDYYRTNFNSFQP